MALMVCIHHSHFNSPEAHRIGSPCRWQSPCEAHRSSGNVPRASEGGWLRMEKIRKNMRGCQFTHIDLKCCFYSPRINLPTRRLVKFQYFFGCIWYKFINYRFFLSEWRWLNFISTLQFNMVANSTRASPIFGYRCFLQLYLMVK